MAERGFDYPEGELGPIYGVQWRGKFPGGVDQIDRLIKGIKANPSSRRHVVTAWNSTQIDQMGLPPCHHTFQVRCVGDFLDLHLTMRSGDMGLGVPFNIASYSILLMLLAKECGKTAREVVITVVDAHLYADHVEPLLEVMDRTVRPMEESGPITLDLGEIDSIDKFIAAHEADPKFRLRVHNYPLPPKLSLPLHT
jgi:thymidylate synthase